MIQITAEWDDQFGKREPGTNAIFLMSGERCLGYIDRSSGWKNRYMACVGAGMEAPVVALGNDLDECKQAVERQYRLAA